MMVLGERCYRNHEGYYSPVYASNGKEVYFITRATRGIVWGVGREFFTPPAHAFILSDHFSLRKIDLQTGKMETVKRWPPSLLTNQHIREYRGRIFFIPQTQLRFSNGNEKELEYKIGLNGPRIENSTTTMFWVTRIWDETKKRMIESDAWHQSGDAMYGYDEFPLLGDWELMAVKGQECYPAAVVAFNHVTSEVRILIENHDFDKLYPDGIHADMLTEFSRRAMIERTEQIKKTHAGLVENFKAEGQSEGYALLKAAEAMERIGYYPKSPTLTAHILTEPEEQLLQKNDKSPIFVIASDEMRSGIFPDIQQAIGQPGNPVKKSMGQYIIHRDYNNSQRLNSFLNTGEKIFYIRYEGSTYELKVNRP